jgi:hypothetical protein
MRRLSVLVVMVATALLSCGLFASAEARSATFSISSLESTPQIVPQGTLQVSPTPTCWPGDKRCWPSGDVVEVSTNVSPTPTCWPGDKRCWPSGDVVEVSTNVSPTPTCWPGDKRCWPSGDVL